MQSSLAKDINDKITRGCLIEARTLLTAAGNLTAKERKALEQALRQIEQEADELLKKAEALEQAGSVTEAKAIYEEAAQRVTDNPDIHAHIKRMNESLLLTRAIKKRGQRLREATAEQSRPPATTKVLAGILAVAGCAGIALYLYMGQGQPPSPASNGSNLAVVPVQAPASPPPPALPPAEEKAAPQASTAAEAQPSSVPSSTPLNVAALPVESYKPVMYTVRQGDSLSLIADRQLCNQQGWQAIFELNRETLDDPTKLQPGMILLLPESANRCRLSR